MNCPANNSGVLWLVATVIGALIVIVSFFLAYINFSALGYTEVQSGLDIISNEHLTSWKYLPIISVVLAVIALLVAVIRKNTGARGVLVATGLLIIILSVAFFFVVDSGSMLDIHSKLAEILKGFMRADYGVYVTIIGGIVLVIAGFLPAKSN